MAKKSVYGQAKGSCKDVVYLKAVENLLKNSPELKKELHNKIASYMTAMNETDESDIPADPLITVACSFQMGWVSGFAKAAELIANGELDLQAIIRR